MGRRDGGLLPPGPISRERGGAPPAAGPPIGRGELPLRDVAGAFADWLRPGAKCNAGKPRVRIALRAGGTGTGSGTGSGAGAAGQRRAGRYGRLLLLVAVTSRLQLQQRGGRARGAGSGTPPRR